MLDALPSVTVPRVCTGKNMLASSFVDQSGALDWSHMQEYELIFHAEGSGDDEGGAGGGGGGGGGG